MKNQTRTADLIVVGGGPAGMMAAITAAEQGVQVLLLERNGYCGKKLNITGKGRCNLTNNTIPSEVIKNIPHGGKFLYSAVSGFSPADVMDWFESRGLPLKTERGDRVFPVSDKAADVSALLRSELHRLSVKVLQSRVRQILTEDGRITGASDEKETYGCQALVLATGGLSYPATGSTGDGYRLAAGLGHSITPGRASIVSLSSEDSFCGELAGLSLKNVKIKALSEQGKNLYEDFGEMLFTHYGVSGPIILSASAHLCDYPFGCCTLEIDLKPALDEGRLDARILREFSEGTNRSVANVLPALLPKSLVPVVLRLADVSPEEKVNAVTKEQRRAILGAMKRLPVKITGLRPVEEAVVTSGGVSLKEIDPRTMGSKLVKGLYFAGELIDADAYTGGFNLQIAWATGHMAGAKAAAALIESNKNER